MLKHLKATPGQPFMHLSNINRLADTSTLSIRCKGHIFRRKHASIKQATRSRHLHLSRITQEPLQKFKQQKVKEPICQQFLARSILLANLGLTDSTFNTHNSLTAYDCVQTSRPFKRNVGFASGINMSSQAQSLVPSKPSHFFPLAASMAAKAR